MAKKISPPYTQAQKVAFVAALKPIVDATTPGYGIPPQVCLAQAVLESAWGKRAAGFNCFGIKGTGPAGTQRWWTREFVDGQWVSTQADFAVYASYHQAVASWCTLIAGSRYQPAITYFAADPARFVAFCWAAGYATAPDYTAVATTRMRQISKMTADPTYNIRIDAGLRLSLARMGEAAFGTARIKVRNQEMRTLFRAPIKPAIEPVMAPLVGLDIATTGPMGLLVV